MEKVTAGIIIKDNKILIAKRKTGKCIGASWEFPGGKLEAGETLEECLKRELKEELNFDVEVKEFVASSKFFCGNKEIELIAYRVIHLSGELIIYEHEEVKWVNPIELIKYDFTLPDVPIVKKVMECYCI
ncbi:MAG TPA: (deoxy)nucleoside triphosphate pyrophosphohydrolase [Candidatus Gastranaerophilales bacterium]|nr:(deoxy)nucleoside triphosphate pyrophosphohydrolase [Candidatus Gastranaerophilales bacterium]